MSEVKTILHANRDGTITFQRHQDVEGILESNKRAALDDEQNPAAFGRRVASIPNMVIEQWIKEGLNIFDLGKDPSVKKKLFQKLNDPEWLYLRTHHSKL